VSRGQSAVEKATFAAGCFWRVEESFRKLPGVISTRVGYTGGWTEHPTYQQVCTGETGHAEAVEITFDASKISYWQLLEHFWKIHDPTTLNRQGWDVGTQYRSAIFTHNAEQRRMALESRERLEAAKRYKDPIVTEIIEAKEFWSAEEYHQKYYKKRRRGVVQVVGE